MRLSTWSARTSKSNSIRDPGPSQEFRPLQPLPAGTDYTIVRYLATLVCLGFGVQALLGIVTLGVAPSMFAMSLYPIAITLLAGTLLFVSLNLLPAIACWTIQKGKRSARAWAIAASLIDIAWTPIVALCTEFGAVLLALLGISGLVAFLGPLLLRERSSAR